MAYTPIVIGSLAWGTPVNNAFTSQDARITDLEVTTSSTAHPLLAMMYDPAMAGNSTALVSGTVYMFRMDFTGPVTISSAAISLVTAGSGLTAGQNLAGLYTAAGTQVAVSADQSAAWTVAGEHTAAFTVPYAAAAGTYYLAILSNGTTPISPVRTAFTGTSAARINRGLTATNARWTTGPAAQTSLPASITMASRTFSDFPFWVGLA